jgi:hypothetical protein
MRPGSLMKRKLSEGTPMYFRPDTNRVNRKEEDPNMGSGSEALNL